MGSTRIRGSTTFDEERIPRSLSAVRGETRRLPIRGLERITRLESAGVLRGKFPHQRWQAELSRLEPHFPNLPAGRMEHARSSALTQDECLRRGSRWLGVRGHIERSTSL